jgi:hypothetical protein
LQPGAGPKASACPLAGTWFGFHHVLQMVAGSGCRGLALVCQLLAMCGWPGWADPFILWAKSGRHAGRTKLIFLLSFEKSWLFGLILSHWRPPVGEASDDDPPVGARNVRVQTFGRRFEA